MFFDKKKLSKTPTLAQIITPQHMYIHIHSSFSLSIYIYIETRSFQTRLFAIFETPRNPERLNWLENDSNMTFWGQLLLTHFRGTVRSTPESYFSELPEQYMINQYVWIFFFSFFIKIFIRGLAGYLPQEQGATVCSLRKNLSYSQQLKKGVFGKEWVQEPLHRAFFCVFLCSEVIFSCKSHRNSFQKLPLQCRHFLENPLAKNPKTQLLILLQDPSDLLRFSPILPSTVWWRYPVMDTWHFSWQQDCWIHVFWLSPCLVLDSSSWPPDLQKTFLTNSGNRLLSCSWIPAPRGQPRGVLQNQTKNGKFWRTGLLCIVSGVFHIRVTLIILRFGGGRAGNADRSQGLFWAEKGICKGNIWEISKRTSRKNTSQVSKRTLNYAMGSREVN